MNEEENISEEENNELDEEHMSEKEEGEEEDEELKEAAAREGPEETQQPISPLKEEEIATVSTTSK